MGAGVRAFSFQGLVAIALWGASFVITRIALEAFSPFGLVSVRALTGTLVLLVFIRLRGERLLPIRADLPICMFLGCVLSVHLLIQAYGLRYTSAIHTGWIIGFIPVSIAIGAHLLRQQRITRVGWGGVLAGTCGVLVVMMSAPPDFTRARFGDLLQVASCLTWTVYTLAGAAPAARSGAPQVTALAMGTAAVVVTLATAGAGALVNALTMRTILAVAFLGFLCSGLAYYLWFQAVTEHGPARTGSLLYLEPFVTLGTAAAVLGEPVTANAIAGGILVLVGVWFVAQGTRHPSLAPDARQPDLQSDGAAL